MSTLIETLKHIEKRPSMYFSGPQRARSIRIIQAFILGFQTAQLTASRHAEFECFTEWVATHYHVLAEGMGGFDIIMHQVGDDESKAFDEFFRLLSEYERDSQTRGRDGILARFCEVQDECMEEFKKENEK